MRARIFLFALALILILFLASGCAKVGTMEERGIIDSLLDDCVEYFDGCNTCTRYEGEEWSCTEKACTWKKKPKCVKYSTMREYEPKGDCIRYFDGCNTCTKEDGEWMCTLRGCEGYREPRCYEIDLTDCIRHSLEGCNDCTLMEDEEWMCTEMNCMEEEWEEPECLEYKVPITESVQKCMDSLGEELDKWGNPYYAAGKIRVRFKPGVKVAEVISLIEGYGLEIDRKAYLKENPSGIFIWVNVPEGSEAEWVCRFKFIEYSKVKESERQAEMFELITVKFEQGIGAEDAKQILRDMGYYEYIGISILDEQDMSNWDEERTLFITVPKDSSGKWLTQIQTTDSVEDAWIEMVDG